LCIAFVSFLPALLSHPVDRTRRRQTHQQARHVAHVLVLGNLERGHERFLEAVGRVGAVTQQTLGRPRYGRTVRGHNCLPVMYLQARSSFGTDLARVGP
jgi:hypothetical protein